MTDKAAITPTDIARTDKAEGLSYLDSLPRRLVTLYLPLGIILLVLLFLSSTVGSEAWNSRDLKSRPH